MSTVFVTGGADLKAQSGSSYFFTQSLRKALGPGMQVRPIAMHTYRTLFGPTLFWGLRNRVDPRKYFFMAREYQEANLVANEVRAGRSDTFISFPKIIPRRQRFLRDFRNVYLFVDMTHTEYFTYGQFRDLPARIRKKLIEQETESYHTADRIFVYSSAVARELADTYGVGREKIEVAGRGLNLPAGMVARVKADARGEQAAPRSRLTIGFIGVDVERKGLIDLVAAIDALPAAHRETLRVITIGPAAERVPQRPFLTALGFLDKERDLERLCRIMAGCDVGYLYSKAEGIPGSVLEFLSLGVPCIVSDIPAMDAVAAYPGVMKVPIAQGAAGVRHVLEGLIARPDFLSTCREALAEIAFDGWSEQARAVARWC